MRSAPIRGAAWPFRVLGAPPAASFAQVRTAYRERMKELHPDKLGHELTPCDSEALAELREAEAMLRTPMLCVQRFGLVAQAALDAARTMKAIDRPCASCSGMGSIRTLRGETRTPCPTCGGSGWQP